MSQGASGIHNNTGKNTKHNFLLNFVLKNYCYVKITNILTRRISIFNRRVRKMNCISCNRIPEFSGVKVSSAAEAEKQLTTMLDFCYRSTDEVFHVFLYEWLIGNGLVNRLLAIKSSYLEPYLRRAAKQPDNLQIL